MDANEEQRLLNEEMEQTWTAEKAMADALKRNPMRASQILVIEELK